MTYNYYCTYCGRELKQSTVLFDMQPVLIGSEESRFRILSFRMTKAELEALIDSGTAQDMGYRQCHLTLQELLKYVSDENNLDNPDIQTLTIADIKEYTTLKKAAEPHKADQSLFSDIFAAEKTDEEVEANQEQIVPETKCKAIESLERASQKIEDIVFTQDDLRSELQILQSLFSTEDTYSFKIKANWEQDNEGNDILIGYTVRTGMPEHNTIVNRRICPYCGEDVFEHAGTAEHRTVTFIGDQKAGKTSTILALAHYARNAATGAMPDDEIWGDSKKVPTLAVIELVSPCARLRTDLENYERGIAPAKTAALKRLDAYSVTFRIKNIEQDRHYLLTLTDLPGELCDPVTGKIDGNKILNEFPIALACDVFVLCFDSSTANGGNALTMVGNACSWAEEFQMLREKWNQDVGRVPASLTKKKSGLLAPVMLIFNKCPDLELPEHALPARHSLQFDSILMTYVFDKERQLIDANTVYQRVGQQIGQYGALSNAYHARLRVSPYGFAAPNELKIADDPSLNLDSTGNIRRPKPKHVAELMNWLLETTGCIPVDGKYCPDPSDEDRYCAYSGNFAQKTQYRTIAPSSDEKDGDIREALLRCHLFENPSLTDISILESYDQRAVLLGERIKLLLKKVRR